MFEHLEDLPEELDRDSWLSTHLIDEYLAMCRESDEREMDALRLYEPLPYQETFHSCTAKECMFQKGNQVGGSLSEFIEFGRALTGTDPYGKYPRRNGVAACLCYGQKHIGRVIYRYLFLPGAFKIIRDQQTNAWRTFRAWEPDEVRMGLHGDKYPGWKERAKPAGPIIPERLMAGKPAYEKRGEDIFSRVTMKSGWVLYALNSEGDPGHAQGFEADLYGIDEDVAKGGWYEEAVARTMMREGLIRWNAMPHSRTEDIVNMIERGEDEMQKAADDPEYQARTVLVSATMYDNIYLPQKSIEENERIWRSAGEDVYRKRALGQITTDSFRAYGDFDRNVHSAIVNLTSQQDKDEARGMKVRHNVQKVITELKGVPPADWCRYFAFDPGSKMAGTLFAARPPPSFGNFVVIYKELYIPNCTARKWGDAVAPAVGDDAFQDFIIDAHGANLREQASGVLPRRQYEVELSERGLRCEVRGSMFMNGSDDIKGRELALRRWIEIRPENGLPILLVVVERCPNLCTEMKRARKKVVRMTGMDVVTDEINRKANVHLMECLEYLAAHGCAYVKPPRRVVQETFVDRVIKSRDQMRQQMRSSLAGAPSDRFTLGPTGR